MKLDQQRLAIDALDEKLIRILAQRFALIAEIKKTKRLLDRSIVDKKREKEILRHVKTLSHTYGISYSVLRNIFKVILAESVMEQRSKQ